MLARRHYSTIIIGLALLVALAVNSGLCHVLYGGEDDEAIRFMDMETELGQELWLEQLETEKRSIEAMPVVKGSVDFFYSKESANLNKVQATVWCCWAAARRSFKQVVVACDDKTRPTHLEALHELRAKLVTEHMCAGHVPNERAVERRRVLEARGEVEATESANAFDRMRVAQARLSLLQKKAALDERVPSSRAKPSLWRARSVGRLRQRQDGPRRQQRQPATAPARGHR